MSPYEGYSFSASCFATSSNIANMSAGASATHTARIGSLSAKCRYDTSNDWPFATHISRILILYTGAPSPSFSTYLRRNRENFFRISLFVRSVGVELKGVS